VLHLGNRGTAETSQRLGPRVGFRGAVRDEIGDAGLDECLELVVGVSLCARR